jgi:hypothetical protein
MKDCFFTPTKANTSSAVPAGAVTHLVHGCEPLTVTRSSAKQSKKESVDCDVMRRRKIQWGLKKTFTARNNMWKHACKYDNCPKKTSNVWEHHTICAICMEENVGNATVKVGSNNSPQPLVEHFLNHHKTPWEIMQNEKQSSIPFFSTGCEPSMVEMGRLLRPRTSSLPCKSPPRSHDVIVCIPLLYSILISREEEQDGKGLCQSPVLPLRDFSQ